MRWYINDLSIQGQFPSAGAFIDAFGKLLELRRLEFLRDSLYCSRDQIGQRRVHGGATVAETLRAAPSRDFRNRVLAWLNTRGPFLETDRQEAADDLFFFAGHEVTEQGLGEAARRIIAAQPAGTFSFVGGAVDFGRTPLEVQQGFDDEIVRTIPVANVWNHDELRSLAEAALPETATWAAMLDQFRQRFDRLLISPDVEAQLARETFSRNVRNNATDLLSVLQEFMENRDDDGTTTARGREIIQTYFGSWFWSESDTNKPLFESEMTFRDPADLRNTLTCYWHGVIQTPQFRIHFEWPVPIGQHHLKVVYIGPKISKR